MVPRYRRGRLPLQACRKDVLSALPLFGDNVKKSIYQNPSL